MELWQLWLLATLDGWNGVFEGLAFLTGFAAFGGAFGFAMGKTMDESDVAKVGKTAVRIATPLFVVFMLLTAAVPSTKGAMMMVGGYFATNLEGIEELPPNIVKAANAFLKQYTQDGK